MTTLERQIAAARLEISADSISMSVSELTNLYREGILEIRPEFQRLFRWDAEQKSRLIESVLLGIPLPSFFVAQSASGKWELVDGLQRTSTLLELQGILIGADGQVRPPLRLTGTKYLSLLEGRVWSSEDGEDQLSEAQKLDIRLARLDLRVIKRSSDPKAKFDLFQRLNSYGSALTAQEIRSAMIAGTNSDCLSWLTKMANRDSFKTTVALSERLLDEQYDIELVLRFLMLHNRDIVGKRAGLTDFPTRLDDWSIDLAENLDKRRPGLERVFTTTFDVLLDKGSEDVFRKWDGERHRFRGSFLNTSFELIALGLGYHIAKGTSYRTDIINAAKEVWEPALLGTGFATGMASEARFARTIPALRTCGGCEGLARVS